MGHGDDNGIRLLHHAQIFPAVVVARPQHIRPASPPTSRPNLAKSTATMAAAANEAHALVIPALKRHTSTLILLHGLGDTGKGWQFLAENFRLRRKFDECAFILPHAQKAIPVPQGGRMWTIPGWFNVPRQQYGGDLLGRDDDLEGIKESIKTLHTLIDEQIEKGIKSERIIVGGFSQGGAIALLGGLTYKHKLGGIMALSTWLACVKQMSIAPAAINPAVADQVSQSNTSKTKIVVNAEIPINDISKDTPIFYAHGTDDNVIKYDWGMKSKEILEETYGRKVEWHRYEGMAHSACPEELEDIEHWMEKRIPPMDK
ncbi:Alpha/Beta hydrolase protein [Pyronema domesticum]|nr:Alpha/Beta hydrolase protein [Pyronema domesticum]